MKNLTQLLSFLAILSVILFSCSKEQINPNTGFQSITVESQINNSEKTSTNITISGVTTYNDMLWFENAESYEKAIEQLYDFQDMEIEMFNTQFFKYSDAQLGQMSEEELDLAFEELELIELEIGFSEEGGYIGFENQLKFKSLRGKIAELELDFLDNANPDWENNPANHHIPFKEEQTVFNEYGEIRIGNYIYILKEFVGIKILDASYETSLAIRYENSDFEKFENIEVIEMNDEFKKSACYYSSSGSFNYPNTNNDHILVEVGVRNSFFGIGKSKAFAKTTNYKRKNNGKWKKKKANTKAKVSGEKCGASSGYFSSSTKSKKTKSLTQKITLGNKSVGGINLHGYHKGINNYATNSSH